MGSRDATPNGWDAVPVTQVTLPQSTLLAAALDGDLARIAMAHTLCVHQGVGMLVVRNDEGRLITVAPDPTVPAGEAHTMTLRQWMGWE